MHLPSELRDQVVSYFLLPTVLDRYPEKQYDTLDWDSFKTLGPSRAVPIWQPDLRTWGLEPTKFYCLELDVASLLGLRLVSRDWHLNATHLLETHHFWHLRFDRAASIPRAVCSLPPPSSPSAPGALRSPVSKLVINDTGSMLSFKRLYEEIIFDNDPEYKDEPQWEPMQEDDREPHEVPDPLQLHYDRTEAHEGMRRVFDHLGCIKAFGLSLPLASADYYSGYSGDDENWAHCYDLIALEEMATTFSYAFMNSDAFQHVIDLRLQVPSTHYVGQLAVALTQDARTRLKHLHIEIMDQTGSCGNREYSNVADPNDREDMADGTIDDDPENEDETNFPYSNVQREHPNRKHQDAMWAFVRSCRNLDSLHVQASHFLDLDLLGWRTGMKADWQGLQVLSLHRIYVSADSLLDLIRPHPEAQGQSRICRISLNETKMHVDGGNWDEVLNYLKNDCPQLECGRFWNMTYFTQHYYYEHNNRIHENVNSIWSERGKDRKALGSLADKLVKRVGQGRYYPDSCLDCISPVTL